MDLSSLKKNPVVRAALRQVKKTEAGRAAVKRVVASVKPRVETDAPPRMGGMREQDFDMLRVEFRDFGATPHLLAQAEALGDNSVAPYIVEPRMWILFAAVHLEAGDRDRAERALRRYVEKFGTGGLDVVLPVAAFAREIGIRSAKIDRAATIWQALTAEQEAFAELVRGKSVAVVGNGPGNVGTGRGAEVDGHDVVIRFNNFPADHAADYGERTDVWVRGAHQDVRDRPFIEPYALVLWEMDFARNFLELQSHAEILYRDALVAPEKLGFIGTAAKRSLRDASGVQLPTSGAQVLWMLHEARGSLDGVDVYGFSTIDGGDGGHYFDQLGDMGRRHDVDGEGSFLRGLLGVADPTADDELVIINCAYRDYDPARGRTGGPAGVLATQRLALGDEHAGHTMSYIFDTGDKGELKRSLPHLTAGLSGKPVDLVLGAEYVRTHPEVTAAIDAGKRILVVCHDLGSALGAQQLGVPYVIVYHQQGSTLQEMRSIGRTPTEHEIAAVTRLEETICAGAERMYFPSDGARQAFVDSAAPGLAEKIAFGDVPLYNTLSAVDHAGGEGRAELLEQLTKKLDLPDKGANLDVFMSVGDWNGDKGLDRVPALLDAYVRDTGRRVLWIAVGSAIDPRRFKEAQEAQKGWSFDARLIGERMTHDRLLALLDYADVYVMLHRRSIFDLATLEAMRAGKGLVLSRVGGNPEFDVLGNVEFVGDDLDDAAGRIRRRDRGEWGAQNRRAYDENFALEHFAERYRAMLDERVAAMEGDA
ncbi:glycosyltransferase family 29 protein [Microbacterium indicum]|uniref:glycosyltransferase family 29 protein n=1 Tax=Microbacterium indicum TaxID=358100 RepID=UPI000418EFBD|nr:glycosyltransferase family 29 protein [Microbacterium indicum]